MKIKRYTGNPIIQPKDVKPSRPDFTVECVFNCGVTRFQYEVLLLMRVAEKPVNDDPDAVLIPWFNEASGKLEIKRFDKSMPGLDLRDTRFVLAPGERWLTSVSHFRIARSADGVRFSIDDAPAMTPANTYEMFGIEDPRITFIDGRYWINYSAISPVTGVTTCLASTADFSDGGTASYSRRTTRTSRSSPRRWAANTGPSTGPPPQNTKCATCGSPSPRTSFAGATTGSLWAPAPACGTTAG